LTLHNSLESFSPLDLLSGWYQRACTTHPP
jgi:hypothetical protein